MILTLRFRLLIAAFAIFGLCQSCYGPSDKVSAAANSDPGESATTLTPAPAPIPGPEGSSSRSAEENPDANTEGANTEGEASPAAQCDLSAQLAQANEQSTDSAYSVIDEQQAAQFEVPGSEVFQTRSLSDQAIDFDERALLSTLQGTRKYFLEQGCQDPKILREGILGTQNISVADVLNTIDFMIETLSADITAAQPTRLKDPNFINQNFQVVRWLAYDPQNINETRLRITKYAVFTHPGSRERTDVYNIPVYKIRDDITDDAFITNYTKQEVLSGIFEEGGAEHGNVDTLAYLSRESFEDALLQGTAYVTFPDGSAAYFNVDKNNGIAYIPGLAQQQQQRYWYFKEVEQLKGYGHSSDVKIPIDPGVTFAGDVLNIGLGKIIAIEDSNQNIRIGMIADTGGAFLPNLHQLDFFAGVFPSRDAYQQAVQQLPTYANTYILLKKEAP